MDRVLQLRNLLPHLREIEILTSNEQEAAYILKKAQRDLPHAGSSPSIFMNSSFDDSTYLVRCLADKMWERIHTGHFSAVPLEVRKIYALANFYRIFFLLYANVNRSQLEKCIRILDKALIIGYTQDLYENSAELERELVAFLTDTLATYEEVQMPLFEPIERQRYVCNVQKITRPSLEVFRTACFKPHRPALLLDTLAHWPALTKWRDLNYIHKMAGYRTVPIEIGSNYANEEWSQQLVKIRDFMRRQFGECTSNQIEYLAQHDLFDQIPALQNDIRIPDYCVLSGTDDAASAKVDIKAWFGPKGTVSPLHYDPKHNLLCQVFGIKRILLAAPDDTPNLYPHETEFMRNTSQADAANLDLTRFPLLERVNFLQVTLQEGDCLYLPPRWWHYVRSDSPSFSVSFWWDN